VVVFVGDRLVTVSIICWVDHLAHEVTEETMAAGCRGGHRPYRAICGYQFVWPVALVTLSGQPCSKCAALLLAPWEPHPTAGRVRRWGHRWPGWWWVVRPGRGVGVRWWS
jgi:hypothetical protein